MKNRKLFLYIISGFALIVVLIVALSVGQTEKSELEVFDHVDYTRNIILNGGFEFFELTPWKSNIENTRHQNVILDDIIKFEGNQSLNINRFTKQNGGKESEIKVYQILKKFPTNKKLILNGRVKTEESNSVFLCIELYSKSDSLLAIAISDTLRGTNDWSHLTTWVRTINPQLSYVKIVCNLTGSGRAWFDKIELYPVEINENIFIPFGRKSNN